MELLKENESFVQEIPLSILHGQKQSVFTVQLDFLEKQILIQFFILWFTIC